MLEQCKPLLLVFVATSRLRRLECVTVKQINRQQLHKRSDERRKSKSEHETRACPGSGVSKNMHMIMSHSRNLRIQCIAKTNSGRRSRVSGAHPATLY